jgi:outer membrane protein assembly factor BamE (lipoprotein component of BamABCDE complex)
MLAPTAVATSLIAGCAMQCQEQFGSLREGMTKAEVEELLGKPSSRWPGERPGEEGTERWQYGDNLSSLATSGVFREPDTNRVFVVWFTADGTVSSYSRPEWASNP